LIDDDLVRHPEEAMNTNQVHDYAHVAVRRIAWREIFPWLILLRVFRIAIAPGPLMLATGALALASFGWWASGFLFLKTAEFEQIQRPTFIGWPYLPSERITAHIPPTAAEYLPEGTSLVLRPFAHLTEPVRQLFDYRTPINQVAYYLFGFLISTAIWTFVGGVITRLALVELGMERSYDWVDAVRYVRRRYLQYFMAPLAPLVALALLGLLLVPLGWLMNIGVGVFVAGLLWLLVIALGLVAAWLMVGLLFGWPLMIAAVGAKRDGDALQAFSEAFSYVYGKPLHYFFYAVVATCLGALALTVVQLFAGFAVEFGFWATSWGAGADDIAKLRGQLAAYELGQPIDAPVSQRSGVWLIGLVLALVNVVVTAAVFSYFFVASAGIFLLLRLAVDDKEMDEVHLDEDDDHLETARQARIRDEGADGSTPPASPPPASDENSAE
jgi:hypothetical protein